MYKSLSLHSLVIFVIILSVLLIKAILVDVKQYRIVVLICISLITNDFDIIYILDIHVCTGHVYIFFEETSIQVLCSF